MLEGLPRGIRILTFSDGIQIGKCNRSGQPERKLASLQQSIICRFLPLCARHSARGQRAFRKQAGRLKRKRVPSDGNIIQNQAHQGRFGRQTRTIHWRLSAFHAPTGWGAQVNYNLAIKRDWTRH